MMRICLNYLQHELKAKVKGTWEWLTPLAFSGMILAIFPFVFDDVGLLKQIGFGLLWIACLLSSLLSAQTLFGRDDEDGTLEQLQISGLSPAMIVFAKTLTHWLTTGVPISLLSPLLMQLFHMPSELAADLIATLLAGTFVLSILGTLSSSLMVGSHQHSMLPVLLTLPLAIPVLILGTSTLYQLGLQTGTSGIGHFLMLMLGLSMILLPLTLYAGTVLLRD